MDQGPQARDGDSLSCDDLRNYDQSLSIVARIQNARLVNFALLRRIICRAAQKTLSELKNGKVQRRLAVRRTNPSCKLRQAVEKNRLFRISRVFGNEQYGPYIRTEIRRFCNGRVAKSVSTRSAACPESKKIQMFSTLAQITSCLRRFAGIESGGCCGYPHDFSLEKRAISPRWPHFFHIGRDLGSLHLL